MRAIRSLLGYIIENDTRVETRAGISLSLSLSLLLDVRWLEPCVEGSGSAATLNGTVDLSPLRETGPSTQSGRLVRLYACTHV